MEIINLINRVDELRNRSYLTEDEEFELIEDLRYLIDETKDYEYAEYLGGIYYDKKMYDLALKYYELAEALGSKWAWEGLGYIWYYGRTGTRDFEKAYYYYSRIAELEDKEFTFSRIEAKTKIADMYKNGYYVDQDYDKYVEIIESLYEEVKDNYYLPRVEVFTRLAGIEGKKGLNERAAELYLIAKNDLIGRLAYNRFFGDLNRMSWLVNDLYKYIEFDQTEFDLYDLYYFLKEEHIVRFDYNGETHEIESRMDEEMNIRLDDKWYRNISEFFINAVIENESIESLYYSLDNWEIVK